MAESASTSGRAAPAESAEEGIIARHVTVTYRNGHTALYDASFATPRGSIAALVGSSFGTSVFGGGAGTSGAGTRGATRVHARCRHRRRSSSLPA